MNKKPSISAVLLYAALHAAHADEPGKDRDPPAQQLLLDDIRGQYAFPGGRLLTMTGSAYRIRAQLDGHGEMVVTRVGPAAFRAADGSFTLRFRPQGNGTVLIVDLAEAAGRAPATDAAPDTGR